MAGPTSCVGNRAQATKRRQNPVKVGDMNGDSLQDLLINAAGLELSGG